jgi:hypothetical protein
MAILSGEPGSFPTPSPRIQGFLLLVGTIVVAALGLPSIWQIHATAALVLMASATVVMIGALRQPRVIVRSAAALTLLSLIAAASAGSIYEFGGGNPGAVDWMGGFAGLAILGEMAMIVWGSSPTPKSA